MLSVVYGIIAFLLYLVIIAYAMYLFMNTRIQKGKGKLVFSSGITDPESKNTDVFEPALKTSWIKRFSNWIKSWIKSNFQN